MKLELYESSDDCHPEWRQLLDTKSGAVVGEIFDTGFAAHTVHCVNAHDDLVQALEAAVDRDAKAVNGVYEWEAQARAALAKARGEK